MNDWVSQMVLLVFVILAGLSSWLGSRKKPLRLPKPHGGGEGEESAPAAHGGTLFNGQGRLLEKALDKAEMWRERAYQAETRCADLERELSELRRAPPRRRPATRRKRTPTTPAT